MIAQTIIHTEVKTESPDSEVHPDPVPGDPELHLGHLAETIIDASVVGSLVILQDNVLRKILL